jgi:hypothetical protein
VKLLDLDNIVYKARGYKKREEREGVKSKQALQAKEESRSVDFC